MRGEEPTNLFVRIHRELAWVRYVFAGDVEERLFGLSLEALVLVRDIEVCVAGNADLGGQLGVRERMATEGRQNIESCAMWISRFHKFVVRTMRTSLADPKFTPDVNGMSGTQRRTRKRRTRPPPVRTL